jgi:hypothetical protein
MLFLDIHYITEYDQRTYNLRDALLGKLLAQPQHRTARTIGNVSNPGRELRAGSKHVLADILPTCIRQDPRLLTDSNTVTRSSRPQPSTKAVVYASQPASPVRNSSKRAAKLAKTPLAVINMNAPPRVSTNADDKIATLGSFLHAQVPSLDHLEDMLSDHGITTLADLRAAISLPLAPGTAIDQHHLWRPMLQAQNMRMTRLELFMLMRVKYV